MHWYDLWYIMSGAILFNLGSLWERRFKSMKFRWECKRPSCYFKVESNNQRALDFVIQKHADHHRSPNG